MNPQDNATPIQIQANELLHIIILAPEKVIFDGEALALTCINAEGQLDILPFHANFISLIFDKVFIKTKEGEQKEIAVGDALLKQMSNEITILTNVNLNEYDELIEQKSKK